MAEFLCFEVRLLDVDEKIWRRFLLKKSATFLDLHAAIQDACGWGNYHMFAFHRLLRRGNVPGRRRLPNTVIAGAPGAEPDLPHPNAKQVKLSSYFAPGGPTICRYQYDFGDDWWHEVKLIETVELPERFTRRLVAGAKAFPPEDCGGVPGYYRCVAAATRKGWRREDGSRAERADLLEWLEGWTPDVFVVDEVKVEFDR